jgi:hypothetical protein
MDGLLLLFLAGCYLTRRIHQGTLVTDALPTRGEAMIVPSIEPQRSTWRAQEDPVFQTWIIWGYFAVRLYQEYEFDS